ncbi:MAG TPA: gamma-glutamyl-gamma-aminobutyrate hydrolase family protein [Candidatus Binataceae bacterium]|nr:gamma-glutamyl-gamma-aminobutyrate hydrolase family protein [Candidatus Binataceae bacterium]
MAKIWVLQHHPAEDLGGIADALEGAALAWQYVRVFNQQPIPREMKGAGGLIVLGGAESVYQLDRYPYLRDEIALIQNALAEAKPVLGVCLGSQLLAAALGAAVRRGTQREIGWYPVRLNAAAGGDRLLRELPREFIAMHWHSDVFDLPSGATALASSELTEVQAFRHGDNAYGIQFHAEVTREILAELVAEFGEGLKRVGIDGEAIATQAEAHLPKLETIGAKLFGRWAAPIQGT